MVRNRQKVRAENWTQEQLQAAVQDVKAGKSIRDAAKLHKVNRETLRRHSSHTTSECGPVVSRNYPFKCVFSQNQEKSLKKYLLECLKMGYGLTPIMCRKRAFEFASKNQLKYPSSWDVNQVAGEDWLTSFMKRHSDLSLRKGEGCSLSRAICFNRNTVNLFFTNLSQIYVRIPLLIETGRIFNLDETATKTVQGSSKLISLKGQKQVAQNTSNERGILVTTCAIISATGQILPPAMIFPRVHFKRNMLNGCYPGTLGLANPSGWMNSTLFLQVMKHFITHSNSSKSNPSLLLYDNHESHLSIEVIDMAKDNGVTLLTLPPHSSHKTQPLDVSIFGPFKKHYTSAMNNWMLMHPGQPVTIYETASFVNEALVKACSTKNIQSGFRATGIFPLNPDIFTDEDFKQSLVTEKPLVPSNPETAMGKNASSEVESTVAPQPLQQPAASNSNGPQSSSSSYQDEQYVSPIDLFGLPKAAAKTDGKARKTRKRKRSIIATDTPVRNAIEMEKKDSKAGKKAVKKASKKLFNESSQHNLEEKRVQKKGKGKNSQDLGNCETALIQTKIGKKRKTCDTSFTLSKKAKLSAFVDSEEDNPDDPLDLSSESESENFPVPVKLNANSFRKLKREPTEGDYVLISRKAPGGRPKNNSTVFYVGKVIQDIDDDRDIQVSYFRTSQKYSNKFVLPDVPDLDSVPVKDVKLILPKPTYSDSNTKRQASLIGFNYDFSDLRMG